MGNQFNIEVREKVATLTSQNFDLVGGNNDYEVVFDFDDAWAGYGAKTALFVFGGKTVSKVFDGNVCEGVAIENATTCYIGVFAGDVVTTTPAKISCITPSITDVGGLPQNPPHNVYNEIIALINNYTEQIIQGLDDLHQIALSYQFGDIEGATDALDVAVTSLESEVENNL